MSADVTCEPHFHVEIYRIHNNFLDVDIKVAQHSFEKKWKICDLDLYFLKDKKYFLLLHERIQTQGTIV
jgi:hypothetical protein